MAILFYYPWNNMKIASKLLNFNRNLETIRKKLPSAIKVQTNFEQMLPSYKLQRNWLVFRCHDWLKKSLKTTRSKFESLFPTSQGLALIIFDKVYQFCAHYFVCAKSLLVH